MNVSRRQAQDVGLPLLLAFMLIAEVLTTGQDVPVALAAPVGLAMTLPLIWRRRVPAASAAVVLTAWLVQSWAGSWDLEPQSSLLAVALTMWSLGAHARESRTLAAGLLGLAAVVAHQPDDAVVMVPLMAGVYAAGRLMRSRDQLATALQRDRVEGERQAVAEERARIARELHDVVAHSISLMTIQAGAERLALGDRRPETTEALQQIEVTGRQALTEMRRMLGMLRDTGDQVELAPLPGLDQLRGLAQRMTAAGLQVDLTVSGTRATVSPGVDISAYRIVQEGLTNVLKHADAGSAQVVVAYGAEELRIDVIDDGAGKAAADQPPGQGLLGMRERVALYGGTLAAGPQPGGGWRLRVHLPRNPA